MAEATSIAEVKTVLGKRRTSSGVEYLVKWKGRGQSKEWWVPVRFLHKSCDMIKAFNRSIKGVTSSKASKVSDSKGKVTKMRSKKGTGKLKSKLQSDSSHDTNGPLSTSHELEQVTDGVNDSKRTSPANGTSSVNRSEPASKKRKYTRNTETTVKNVNNTAPNKKQTTRRIKGRNAVKAGVRLASTTPQRSKPTAKKPVPKLVSDKNILSKEGSAESTRSTFTQCRRGKSSSSGVSLDAKKLPIRLPGLLNGMGKKGSSGPASESYDSASVTTSDSEGVLYSLADADVSSSESSDEEPPAKRRRTTAARKKQAGSDLKNERPSKELVLKIKDLKHELTGTNTTTTPDSDHEVTFKTSPRKLLLKDSIRPKDKSNKLGSPLRSGTLNRLPQSPPSSSAAPTTCQTPPRPSSVLDQRDPSPSLGSTNNLPKIPSSIPILPNSPPTPCYDILIKRMTYCNQGKGVRRNLGADTKEPVERRVSVRHSESAFKYKEIVVRKNQNYTQIWLFSQTKRKNALNPKVFEELIQAFHNAKFDDTRVVLLTGSGKVFCSGIDLHYLTSGSTDRKTAAKTMSDSMRDFVNVLVEFPKPVVAAVNGPAVGLGVSILPLCDIVYASDKASFCCPYTKLGQTPEGCASHTFPQAMGLAMANELLLPGRKITALEAYQLGLVSQVFWPTSMMQEVIPRLQQMAVTSAKALEATKVLIRSHMRGKLQLTVETECQMLTELWPSSECQRAILNYIEEDEDMML